MITYCKLTHLPILPVPEKIFCLNASISEFICNFATSKGKTIKKMADTSANNKRIAKNTMFLYVRMFFSMFVSLYTSRVVLQTLGVEDFGIYGVVGGVVSMFTFLNASMSGATGRFLTFELGRKDYQKLADTFAMAFWEHLAIAGVIFVIAETVGLWFMITKMVIPESRMFAAHVVYQLSILSMMVSVTQVPYNASIIAHERMDVYAYVEILNVILKLGIVFLLVLGNFDKLIFYAILVLAVSISIAMIYRIYCIRHFQECRIRAIWRPDIFKPMLQFSGWDIYGNMSITARTQGVNMLLNVFFGPIMNAAATIATQVQAAVLAFVSSVLSAVRPQIVKYYATQQYHEMCQLIRNACKLNFFILTLLTVPCMAELHFLLTLWLGNVPDHTISFCIFTLLFNFFSNLSTVVVTGIHATGDIKRPSLINGTLYLSVIPFTYMAYKLGSEAWVSYLFNVCAVFIGMLSNAYTLRLFVKEFPLRTFIFRDILSCLLMLALGYALTLCLRMWFDEGWLRFILSGILSTITTSAMGWLFILPLSVRKNVKTFISQKICKKV